MENIVKILTVILIVLLVLLVLVAFHMRGGNTTSSSRTVRVGVEDLCANIARSGPRKDKQLDSRVIEVDNKYLCIVGDPRISRYEIAAIIEKNDIATGVTK